MEPRIGLTNSPLPGVWGLPKSGNRVLVEIPTFFWCGCSGSFLAEITLELIYCYVPSETVFITFFFKPNKASSSTSQSCSYLTRNKRMKGNRERLQEEDMYHFYFFIFFLVAERLRGLVSFFRVKKGMSLGTSPISSIFPYIHLRMSALTKMHSCVCVTLRELKVRHEHGDRSPNAR